MWVLATEVTLTPTLLGIAAFLSATGGIATTIMALRKNKSEEHEECLKRLAEARAESERLAQEIHWLKMGGPNPDEN